jgi:precorrin-3B methylase
MVDMRTMVLVGSSTTCTFPAQRVGFGSTAAGMAKGHQRQLQRGQMRNCFVAD